MHFFFSRIEFEVTSFSFSFVGQMNMKIDVDLTPGVKPSVDHNIVRPGLNYRAVCEDKQICNSTGKDWMIINRGFGKFKPRDEIVEEKLKCSKCSKVLNECASIKQIVLFQAEGDIVYQLDSKTTENANFTVVNNRIIIYGDAGNTEKYSAFSITVNPQVFNFNKDQRVDLKFDTGGNPIGSVFDLGVDGAFKHVKLLIGKFYNGQGFTQDSFSDHVGKAFNSKGFDWYCTENEDEFLQKLPSYNVAWVISASAYWGTKMKNTNFPDKVIDFHRSGKGLMLWEDNDASPGGHTTQTLQKLFGMTLEGNDPGTKTMVAAPNCSGSATFMKSHPIATGLTNLYEGITICHPTSTPNPLKILANSSSGHPAILYVDEEKSPTICSGRVIIDCGWTKLFKQFWDTTGTARYVRNATCWLSGFSCDTM